MALANEGGGKILLGITDKRPRTVVGTRAFDEPGRTEAGLFETLHQRVTIEEYLHDGKRVLIVRVPPRLPGNAWQYKGAYWMRSGDALVPMTDDQLQRIHDETGPDFSQQPRPGATMDDLHPAAVELLRNLWQKKTPAQNIAARPDRQLLADAELMVEARITYAALILLGTRQALGRHLGQAEIIFEYRSNESAGPAAERYEFRQGFLPILDTLWQRINLRNDMQHFQQGLFVWDMPTFNERAVREAVLNAVCHCDYRSEGSVLIRQFPRRIEIINPGGFPPGINIENLLWQQNLRNRRVAEALARCGLVERAGQGFDLICRECIRHSKPLPDFSRTDAHFVWVTLKGEIQDPGFCPSCPIGEKSMSLGPPDRRAGFPDPGGLIALLKAGETDEHACRNTGNRLFFYYTKTYQGLHLQFDCTGFAPWCNLGANGDGDVEWSVLVKRN